ncbi:hypothetical protein CAPTEDRAFT_162094 [Capitella teleta]|uniref:Pyroglutamyl-peptidase I n=1 Tax=Capitella teleta TaxID=283909 RepID=R7UQZ6_CAPTE|nr:hypothetical protein CAPTEDRAFT_162094 [Capitella teleta]|eukprot:ELU08570.1 hypothetical protein CAPTEDRAFT_162094 [Capitella teleta]
MGDNSEAPKTTVLLTGFGPFGSHSVNASWVAVEQLSKEGVSEDVNLIVEEVPVLYNHVRESIPALWQKHKPKLVVHVGVSSIAQALTLEQQAHNDGYNKFDVKGDCPPDGCCVQNSASCIASAIDMRKVCEEVNAAECGVQAVISMDPGRYLCDFIFYTSLNQDRSCSAFIHVPPLNQPYTAKQLAAGIRESIKAMLRQLQTK